jgi:hypothetical protein
MLTSIALEILEEKFLHPPSSLNSHPIQYKFAKDEDADSLSEALMQKEHMFQRVSPIFDKKCHFHEYFSKFHEFYKY